MTYDYKNRAEFMLAGFRVEPDGDGWKLTSKEPMESGGEDWQCFPSGGALIVWLAAGISEIETAGFVSELYLKAAKR